MTTVDTGFVDVLPYETTTPHPVRSFTPGAGRVDDQLGRIPGGVWVHERVPAARFEPFLTAGLVMLLWAAHLGLLARRASPHHGVPDRAAS